MSGDVLGGLSKGLTGVAAHRELPEGETLGATFTFGGETYYVTQAEVDRVKNLPSADEIRGMVARFNQWRSKMEADRG
jgi:hypothetical protein